MELNLTLELASGIEGEPEMLGSRKEHREVFSAFGESDALFAMLDSTRVLTRLPVMGGQIIVNGRMARNVADSLRKFARLEYPFFQLIVPSKWP
jgi:hypothetical protein